MILPTNQSIGRVALGILPPNYLPYVLQLHFLLSSRAQLAHILQHHWTRPACSSSSTSSSQRPHAAPSFLPSSPPLPFSTFIPLHYLLTVATSSHFWRHTTGASPHQLSSTSKLNQKPTSTFIFIFIIPLPHPPRPGKSKKLSYEPIASSHNHPFQLLYNYHLQKILEGKCNPT